jgi:hypothetical protein
MHVDDVRIEPHRTTAELVAGVDHIRASPADGGVLELIVRRPERLCRELLDVGELDLVDGLRGDCWRTRGSRHTPDGSAMPGSQLAIMNARVIALVAGDDHQRWALAGDQLFLDLDLSSANLPTGTRLALGDAVLEITDDPHNGCPKFAARFGNEALRFVNVGTDTRPLRMRGIQARVVQPGTIRTGDRAVKT